MNKMLAWLQKIDELPEQQRIVALDLAFNKILQQLSEIDTSEEQLLSTLGFNRATLREMIDKAKAEVEAER